MHFSIIGKSGVGIGRQLSVEIQFVIVGEIEASGIRLNSFISSQKSGLL